MKHYVMQNDQTNAARSPESVSERVRNVDVILRCSADKASAGMVVEFFRALNTQMGGESYVVTLRVLAEDKAGGPLYWGGRTAIFWGDTENSWSLTREQKSWVAQVMNLSPRSLLVGGAVMLLAQTGGSDRKVAAIHPSFEMAAQEYGISNCGATSHLSATGRLHSANSGIGALRLLAEFVSLDHGQHLADTLLRYIGLDEPGQAAESQTVNRLIRKASGDQLVMLTLKTMLGNIEEPLTISALSELVGTSTRQLQRRYLRKTGSTLLDTYRELRLERVRCLLKHSDLPLVEIAAATGFSSRASMSRAFVRHYNSSPEESRNRRYLGCAGV